MLHKLNEIIVYIFPFHQFPSKLLKNKKYILFNPLLVQRLSQKNAHVKKQSILSGQANV